ncbi:MAG: DUF1559 domain-containing protein [Planctomycetota bacterium]|nr:DUF1559 domain-containing protein [Planctomycetota bacterium]
MSCQSNRSGLTLIELIVALTILCIGMALVVPAVQRAREHARSETCRNNLREIGFALHAFAAADPNERFCRGAFDPQRDGSPDTYGWVADVIKIKGGNPNELRCVANPVQGLAALNDLIEKDALELEECVPVVRQRAGRVGAGWPDITGKPTAAGSAARADQVRRFVREGYNTNYSASWYLVRTGPLYRDLQNELAIDFDMFAPGFDMRDLGNSQGPLTRRSCEWSDAPTANIPLLGDCAESTDAESGQSRSLMATGVVHLDRSTAGSGLGKSFCDGPCYWDGSKVALLRSYIKVSSTVPSIAPEVGDAVTPLTEAEYASVFPAGPLGHKLILQDTRAWFSRHPGGTANLLMADGSVKILTDRNGDGYFNPGFPVDETIDKETLRRTVGYTSAQCEIPAFEVWTSAMLDPSKLRRLGCEF